MRDHTPPRLLAWLRLLLVVLAVQVSGGAPALAHAARAVASLSGADDHCPCCEAEAEQRRLDVNEAAAQHRPLIGEPDCCAGDGSCADCPGSCVTCQISRDARSYTAAQATAVASAPRAERVAASSTRQSTTLYPHLPGVYRPPCS